MEARLVSLSGAFALLFAVFAVAGCNQRSSSAPTRMAGPPPGTWIGASRGAAQHVEAHRPTAPRHFSSALIYLANNAARQLVNFEVVDGIAVLEGDILLGPATFVPFRYGFPQRSAVPVQGAMAVRDRTDLWPRGDIPYFIDASVSATTVEWINWAISHVNTTQVKLRPRAGESDYVVFRDSGGGSGCSSYVGHVGGAQEIQVADCGRGSVIHEILHAAGFFHEQSRDDRDDFVTIMFDEIVPEHRSNFEKTGGRGENIGPYDYQSIMHYSGRAFSRTGKPTIIPRIQNAGIGQREGLSQGDRTAIQALYGGSAPPLPTPQPPPPTSPSAPVPGTNFPFPIAGLPLPSLPFPMPSFPFPTTTSTPSTSAPPTAPAPAPAGPVSFTGNYASTRGPMQCAENASMVACSFQDGGIPGRLDCVKQTGSVTLSCTWMTFFPRPGSGRAALRRSSTTDPNLSGTWGNLHNDSDGGRWDVTRQ